MPKLKVYRTPIGFHDAYIAASSQKAALQAWGSDANLFARGVAEIVTDPKLTDEPLSRPGEIIRRARGTDAEHFAALPKEKRISKKSKRSGYDPDVSPVRHPKRPPPPRTRIEAAERAIEQASNRHRAEIVELAKREKELAAQRRKTETAQEREMSKLKRVLNQARNDYEKTLRDWEP
jgi:hypothetical protein